MSDPFIGEIRLFGFNRVPINWLACDGSLQSIAIYEVLYTLLGTVYGGDGVTTFALPDLRGRVPMAQGNGRGLTPRALGELGGEASHTLVTSEMPLHGHALLSTTNVGTTATPDPSVHMATTNVGKAYAPQAKVPSYLTLAPSVGMTGDSVAHDNMMPTLVANYCICSVGVFPPPP